MSESSNVGAPLEGVVRNSALSFLSSAPAQPTYMQSHGAVLGTGSAEIMQETPKEINQTDRLIPAGLKSLCDACSRIYPDQPNPLQVTTRLKYWLGGHDPLDYISMYWNPGKPEEHIPSHWHYVSFGLSDLHGDGRVHPPPDRVLLSSTSSPPSGYGLELTLRLSAEPGTPPLWPAALLQALARYVFTTGNKFCAGDHISWHAPLDGSDGADTRVRHLLVANDPHLGTVDTPHGTVSFLQMVGCTGRELRAAQRGSGFEVLKLIGEDVRCGGPWLVTVAERRCSARLVRSRAGRGPLSRSPAAPPPPAPLAGVSAKVRWRPWDPLEGTKEPSCPGLLTPTEEQQIKETLQRGLSSMSMDKIAPEGHMSTDSFKMSSIERALPEIPELMQGSWPSEDCSAVEYLDGVHVILNAEGASLLPLAIDGRIRHGRHFTWRARGRAVTAAAPAVAGALATPAHPLALAAGGTWLQILIPKELAEEMSQQVSALATLADTDSESEDEGDSRERDRLKLPLTLAWPKYRLKLTVVDDNEIL